MCDCNGGVKKGKEKKDEEPSEEKKCPLLKCKYNIIGPENVPGLSKYKYKIDVPSGKTATKITWTVDKATAGFDGSTNKVEVTVTFQNTTADWIKLRADFTMDGKCECAEKQIALVKVDVEAPTFTKPGKPSGSSPGSKKVFLVNPPPLPATPTWVTTNDPGSNCGAFTYNGSNQPAEPRKKIFSNGGGGGAAFEGKTKVTLTAPTEKPTAIQRIQVGYIQHLTTSGSADYATTPAGGNRTVVTPVALSLDWLSSPCSPGGTDEWPWYDEDVRATGSGTGSWSKTFTLTDSPALSIPAQYNPNKTTDGNATKPISTTSASDHFAIQVGARTLDTDLTADKHYFDEAHSTWTANYAWPVVPGVSIVTTGTTWIKPGSPSELSVNIVPGATNGNGPFLRWIPS